MNEFVSRRQFLRASAIVSAGLALPKRLLGSETKSLLVFTKSSGWEHDVVKSTARRPCIVEHAVTVLGEQHSFEVSSSKDGRIFDSKDFRKHAAVLFFTT